MKYSVLAALAVVAALLLAGTAAATGVGFAAQPADDRPQDGTYNPWTADDPRLERIQERYDLTDDQVAEIQQAVEDAMADGYDRLEIQTTVHETLESFGIDVGEPLGFGPAGAGGPPADADRRHDGYRHGGMGGPGGFGLQDGSCLS